MFTPFSLSKKRLPDGQAHDCTELDSWASLPQAHLPRNAIYARNQRPFKKSDLSKARESVCGASEGSVTNSEESQSQANLTLSPTSQSEAIKNNSTKQKNRLKKKKRCTSWRGKKANKPYKPHIQVQWTILQHQRRMQTSLEPRWRETHDPSRLSGKCSGMCTLITLTNK